MSGTPTSPRRHIRLIFALVVASLLGTFAVYTAFAEDATPLLTVAELQHGAYAKQKVRLDGKVIASSGDASSAAGMRMTLRDFTSSATVQVIYHGAVPDAYRIGRHIVVDGALVGQTFVAKTDSLVTKCPSKYQDKPAPTGTTGV